MKNLLGDGPTEHKSGPTTSAVKVRIMLTGKAWHQQGVAHLATLREDMLQAIHYKALGEHGGGKEAIVEVMQARMPD